MNCGGVAAPFMAGFDEVPGGAGNFKSHIGRVHVCLTMLPSLEKFRFTPRPA